MISKMKNKKIIEAKSKNNNFIHENHILNKVFQVKGLESPDDLDLSPKNLISPFTLKDMDKATDCLMDHYYEQSRIVIVGDFDCDGATSTTAAKEGLELLGFKNVDFIIPDRMKHGYGLTESIAKLACEMKPDLVITVDCGISSFDGAEYIHEQGIELIITDHHLQAKNGLIPPCAAAVNPNRNDCTSNLKNLAGCGVMLYTIIALRAKMRDLNIFKDKGVKQPSINQLLDIVSLGTVADIVHFDKNNRILVKMGLDRVRSGAGRPAIHEVLTRNQYTSPEKVKTSDWGFILGPILNAAGRLDNMTKGIEMLLSRSQHEVKNLVTELIDLNETRKSIGKDMEDTSEELLAANPPDMGVVLYNKNWHEGVVGILASRVKDRSNRPSICLTATHEAKALYDTINALEYSDAPKDELDKLRAQLDEKAIKGSCRSIPGVHLKHILDKISGEYPDLLTKFGGHAMAAGVSLPHGNLKQFQEIFNRECDLAITPEMIAGDMIVDIKDIPSEYLNLDTFALIDSYAPWGKGFEMPLFSSKFVIKDFRLMGDDKTHVKFTLSPEGSEQKFNAIMWRGVDGPDPDRLPFKIGNTIETVFKLDRNEFRGHVSVQLMLEHYYDEARELELLSGMKSNNAPSLDR